ncbi:Acaa1b 3-ketoacyl-CoA thiolase B [Candida maltosa Xu316]|uniref:Uncharacterized protein n=1 Tax=Candida maltosa (strain Xu316) TaxID=1245528 RepID=M3K8E0_CANMX|nr:hypothetical protein G210_0974 [Candida maltosa Xu316]
MFKKSANDIVILAAKRTPVTKSLKGGLNKLYPEELLYHALSGTLADSKFDPNLIDDVLVGTVLQALGGQKASALAVKKAGFPIKTTVNTVNRQCASSGQALTYQSGSLLSGENQFAIAAGVESMTHDYFPHRGIPTRISEPLFQDASDEAKNVLMPMGITSENVAEKYGITREAQDKFALNSHLKADKATKSGFFAREIIPIETTNENGEPVVISKDDGVRGNSTLEKLSTLKPVFKDDGTTTAGNSSQISDGASAAIITTRANAEKIGVKPIARFVGSSVAGVPSGLMGIGPSLAIPQLLNRLGLETKDIDIFELNEAFASQSIYCIEKLGLDYDKVNPYGGAIALGHALGNFFLRILCTTINGLKTQEKEVGVISMCTSTGSGYAALIVNE